MSKARLARNRTTALHTVVAIGGVILSKWLLNTFETAGYGKAQAISFSAIIAFLSALGFLRSLELAKWILKGDGYVARDTH